MTQSDIQSHNQPLFEAVKKLNLSIGQYAITQSGALGIRGIRKVGDIDIVVSDSLWEELAEKYGVHEERGFEDRIFKSIKISDDIEIIGRKTFEDMDPEAPSIDEQISQSEIIEDLPFVNLQHVLFFKKKLNRPKDQPDIAFIKTLLNAD